MVWDPALGSAHRIRTGGVAFGRRWADQPGGGSPAVRLPSHGQRTPQKHLRQGRRAFPSRTVAPSHAPRPSLAGALSWLYDLRERVNASRIRRCRRPRGRMFQVSGRATAMRSSPPSDAGVRRWCRSDGRATGTPSSFDACTRGRRTQGRGPDTMDRILTRGARVKVRGVSEWGHHADFHGRAAVRGRVGGERRLD